MSADPVTHTTATHPEDPPIQRTPLHALHVALGAKMVPFAGYDMPLHYEMGILGEHQHTRAAAGLFDVSHMGQAQLVGHMGKTQLIGGTNPASALEQLVPGDITGLGAGDMRYTLLLNETGGIIDDLMVTRLNDLDGAERLGLIVNAACKAGDFTHMEAHLAEGIRLNVLSDRALLALQGPRAHEAMAGLCPAATELTFMQALEADIHGIPVAISRSGYTGEDGFEISVPEDDAERFARLLLEHEAVSPVGLGARDSLRLEAGLCLYGHDIDADTSPVEAALTWAIAKRRRGEANFPGADRILGELADGPRRRRVGILPEGRAPAREGAEICDESSKTIGVITSGGFGPTVGGPIAMGYVEYAYAAKGTPLKLMVRGKALPAHVAPMPFAPHRYYRGKNNS